MSRAHTFVARALAPALMLLLPAQALAEPPLIGRLFTSPAERATLDSLRSASGRPAPVGQASAEPAAPPPDYAEPPPPPEPVVVTGIVKRSDGRSTVWINNAPQQDAAVQRTGPAGAATVTVPLPGGQQATVKAGQQLDVTTGEVRDAPATR